MRVAVISQDKGELYVYKDFLFEFKPDLFDSPLKFDRVFSNQYDVIILTHRYGKTLWTKIYDDLKSDALFIITASYNVAHYKKEFPNLYYNLTKSVSKHKNVIFLEKDKREEIYDIIETRCLKKESLDLIKKK